MCIYCLYDQDIQVVPGFLASKWLDVHEKAYGKYSLY